MDRLKTIQDALKTKNEEIRALLKTLSQSRSINSHIKEIGSRFTLFQKTWVTVSKLSFQKCRVNEKLNAKTETDLRQTHATRKALQSQFNSRQMSLKSKEKEILDSLSMLIRLIATWLKTSGLEKPKPIYTERLKHILVTNLDPPQIQSVGSPVLKLRLDRLTKNQQQISKRFSDEEDLISNRSAFESHRSAFESHRSSNRIKITPRPPGSNAPNSHRSKIPSVNASFLSEENSLIERLCEMYEANKDINALRLSQTKSSDGWKSEFDDSEEQSGINVAEVKQAISVLKKANLLDADLLERLNKILHEPNSSSNLELLFQCLQIDPQPGQNDIHTVQETSSDLNSSSENSELLHVTLEDILKAGRLKEAIKRLESSPVRKIEDIDSSPMKTDKEIRQYDIFSSPKLPQGRKLCQFEYHNTISTDVSGGLRSRLFKGGSSDGSQMKFDSKGMWVTPQTKEEIRTNF